MWLTNLVLLEIALRISYRMPLPTRRTSARCNGKYTNQSILGNYQYIPESEPFFVCFFEFNLDLAFALNKSQVIITVRRKIMIDKLYLQHFYKN